MSSSEPSVEQIADDKAKLANFNSLKAKVDKHLKRGGKAGFFFLGFAGLIIFIMLAGLAESHTSSPPFHTEGGKLAGFLALAGVAVLVCSCVFGFQYMDDEYNKAIKKQDAYNEENKVSEIQSRMATYPSLYE